jgi:hypothetical protein
MSPPKYNVFISFSGDTSLAAAKALREWIPTVVQSASPFMSDSDVEKRTRGLHAVARALEGIKFGIACLTPDNLESAWILYEAGALTKTIDDETHLCTYLLRGLQPQDVKPPLGMFQATKAEKEDTRRLVHTINRAVNQDPVADARVDQIFDAMWPRLEADLRGIPEPPRDHRPKRSQEEMIAELLELARADANRRRETEWFDQYIPTFKEFMPLLEQLVVAVRQQEKAAKGSAQAAAPAPQSPAPRSP